jgi:hypothetical protein
MNGRVMASGAYVPPACSRQSSGGTLPHLLGLRIVERIAVTETPFEG